MTKTNIILFVCLISILFHSWATACDRQLNEAKYIEFKIEYPRGYLYSNYTPCKGQWYPKGYCCYPNKIRSIKK